MKKIILSFIIYVTTITLSGCSIFEEPEVSVKSIYTEELYTFNVEATRKDYGLQDIGIVGFESKLSLSNMVRKIQENTEYDIQISSRSTWCEIYINDEQFYLFKESNRDWYNLSSNLVFDDSYGGMVLMPMHLINPTSIESLTWFNWNTEIKLKGTFTQVIEYYTNQDCYTVTEDNNEYIVSFTEGHLTKAVEIDMVSFKITNTNSGITFSLLTE